MYTLTLKTALLATAFLTLPVAAQTGHDTRVVVGSPESSLLSTQKEHCDFLFINPDGTDALPAQNAPQTPRRVVETPMDTPFGCDFSQQSDLDLFTVIDANRDAKTWEWNSQGFLAVMYNSYQSANDWLISPGLNLNGGYIYTFTTAARPYQSQYPEKLEMWVGTAPTTDGMTQCILPAVTLTEEQFLTQSADFIPETDGVYYFAVRAVSDADMYALLINNFNVSAGTSGKAPARPAIEAIRDAGGEPRATINITAPTITVVGETLADITALNIYRDDTLIHTATDITPGAAYSYVDNEPSVAMHTYTAECVNADGAGPKAESSCFTGIYYAVWPDKVIPTVGDNEGAVHLEWTPCLTDILGNPLGEDQVTYTIYRIHNGNVGELVSGLTQPRYDDQVCGADDPQRDVQYTVMSKTSYGQSAGTGSGIFYAGKPYDLPYSESVPAGQLGSLMFSRGLANYAASWDIANIETYELPYPSDGSDGDGGFLYHRAYNVGEQAAIGTAKIHIPDNAESATLTFDTFLNGTDATPNNNTLEVKVIYNGEETSLGVFTQHGDPEWATFTADLTSFAGKTIQVSWTNTVMTHVLTTLDNIRMDYEAKINNAVDSLSIDNNDTPRYYNLQGIEIRQPASGEIVIVRRGNSATREIFRK